MSDSKNINIKNSNVNIKIDEQLYKNLFNNPRDLSKKSDEVLNKINHNINIGKDKFGKSEIKSKEIDTLHEIQDKCKDIDIEKIIFKDAVNELNKRIIDIKDKASMSVNKKQDKQVNKEEICSNTSLNKSLTYDNKIQNDLFSKFVNCHNDDIYEYIKFDGSLGDFSLDKKSLGFYIKDYQFIYYDNSIYYDNFIGYVSKKRNVLTNVVISGNIHIYY